MKKVMVLLAAIMGIAASASIGSAAGFRLPDQDAAAMGMAGAFAGQADNPSATWYNPAGITQLDGTRMSAGVTAIYPVISHENADGSTDVSERKVHLPAQLFATSRVNDKTYFGLGINSPFGLSTNWADSSETSTVATLSRVKTVNINPNIAYKINDGLSVAAGLDYTILQATMAKLLGPGVLFRLDGDGAGVGVNAGIKAKANDRLDIGLSYRSRIKIKVDGTADVSALGLSNSASTDLVLPDLVQFGVSYKASEKLILNADLEYTWWSTYDRVIITSDTIRTLTGGATDTSVEEKDWKNTWSFRIGGQYQLSEQWKLRAGYVYDQNPVPSDRFDTRVPDSDRQGVTIGTGYAGGNITVDASYMYLVFKNRAIDNSLAGGSTPVTELNGTYKGSAHLAGITVAYKF